MQYIDSLSLEKVSDFVEAACILHNFCLFHNDDLPAHMVAPKEHVPQPHPDLPPAVPGVNAIDKRNTLMNNLW